VTLLAFEIRQKLEISISKVGGDYIVGARALFLYNVPKRSPVSFYYHLWLLSEEHSISYVVQV
jgi:hypothetical protein